MHRKQATWKKVSAKRPAPPGSRFPREYPGKGPTHRAVAHAGGRCQRLLQSLALPQRAGLRRAQRPLASQQVAENVAVAPQCTVDQRALAFLIQVVHLGGERGQEQGKVTAEHHFVTVTTCAVNKPHPTADVRGSCPSVSLWRVSV